jgi:hypothetical protein
VTDRKIAILVHSESGVGKSRLLDTAPGPRLVLDVEGGTDWTPSEKVRWDPATAPPTGLTPDQTVVVTVLEYETVRQVYQWLSSGKHEFVSVCLDSITEIQKRCKDVIGGVDTFNERQWGELLNKMELLVRQYRDLRQHPTRPVNVFISALTNLKDDIRKADVQGALARNLPSFVDVVGYLYTEGNAETGTLDRRMLIQPSPGFQAKDRTDVLTQRFGTRITTSECDLTCITDIINGRA